MCLYGTDVIKKLSYKLLMIDMIELFKIKKRFLKTSLINKSSPPSVEKIWPI